MKLVLDTNIVVSAALGNIGDGALIAAIEAGQHDAFASAEMLGEYRGALARLVPEKAEAWMARLARILAPTEGAPGIAFRPDPTDAKFIACTLVQKRGNCQPITVPVQIGDKSTRIQNIVYSSYF
jgi:predicted nucleic acid-binding protein